MRSIAKLNRNRPRVWISVVLRQINRGVAKLDCSSAGIAKRQDDRLGVLSNIDFSVWLALIVLLKRCELSTVTAFQTCPEVLIVKVVSLVKASPVNVTALLVRVEAVSLMLSDVFFELDDDFFCLSWKTSCLIHLKP